MIPARARRAAIAVLPVLLLSARAEAHEVGLSRGDYRGDGKGIRAELAFARKELAGLVAGLDANHDGALTEAELQAGRDSIQGAIVGRVKVAGDGAACPGKLDRVELAEQDGVVVSAVYACARRPAEARVTLGLLEDLPFGHRHLVRATQAAGPLDIVLSQRVPAFSFAPPPAPVEPPTRAEVARLGAKHAATAWALPVFLVGLLVRCEARRRAIFTAALFGAAVVIGLVAASLGVFAPSPRAVGIAIAMSLVYAGIDGLAPRPSGALAALPFGVVHGFGGAAAFRAAEAPSGLLGMFVVGVVGVLAATAVVIVPVVERAPRARIGRLVSGAVLLAGLAQLARLFS